MDKKKIIKIALLLLALWYFVFSHIMIVPGIIESDTELYDMTTKALLHNKSNIIFKCDCDPDDLYYEDILDEALEKNIYAGCEFYEYRYTYFDRGDYYKVRLNLKKPRLYKRILSKIRIKQVARHFKHLSDYDKVKAAHDYIINYNDYFRAQGGAYATMWLGHSACNGYALSFYALMNELDVPVTYETGDNHMWNTVYVDGKWYNIDLTWDDVGYGKIRYDYFLKCNADWGGHDYGSSDAEESLPVKGMTAKEYCRMVPPYKLITFISIVIIVGGSMFASIKIVKKKKEDKFKQDQLQEKLLMQYKEESKQQMKFEKELEAVQNSYESENDEGLDDTYNNIIEEANSEIHDNENLGGSKLKLKLKDD